jgi:hypothetical protein
VVAAVRQCCNRSTARPVGPSTRRSMPHARLLAGSSRTSSTRSSGGPTADPDNDGGTSSHSARCRTRSRSRRRAADRGRPVRPRDHRSACRLPRTPTSERRASPSSAPASGSRSPSAAPGRRARRGRRARMRAGRVDVEAVPVEMAPGEIPRREHRLGAASDRGRDGAR